jgi:uncharacterized protein
MTLMQKIKQDQVEARKNRDTIRANLLTTLIGEAEMVGKNSGNRESTDAEVAAVIKKFVKNAEETLTALKAQGTFNEAIAVEVGILNGYLPQQLSEYELKAIAEGRSGMPDFMKYLKDNYAGQYDGRLASQVAREVYAA